jgi:hypothetical protein
MAETCLDLKYWTKKKEIAAKNLSISCTGTIYPCIHPGPIAIKHFRSLVIVKYEPKLWGKPQACGIHHTTFYNYN